MTKEKRAADDWREITRTQICAIHRTGWQGVWDALVSVITGRKRLTVEREFIMSVWVKGAGDVRLTGPKVFERTQP